MSRGCGLTAAGRAGRPGGRGGRAGGAAGRAGRRRTNWAGSEKEIDRFSRFICSTRTSPSDDWWRSGGGGGPIGASGGSSSKQSPPPPPPDAAAAACAAAAARAAAAPSIASSWRRIFLTLPSRSGRSGGRTPWRRPAPAAGGPGDGEIPPADARFIGESDMSLGSLGERVMSSVRGRISSVTSAGGDATAVCRFAGLLPCLCGHDGTRRSGSGRRSSAGDMSPPPHGSPASPAASGAREVAAPEREEEEESGPCAASPLPERCASAAGGAGVCSGRGCSGYRASSRAAGGESSIAIESAMNDPDPRRTANAVRSSDIAQIRPEGRLPLEPVALGAQSASKFLPQ